MGLGTVGKVFAVQEQGSKFGPQNLYWKKKTSLLASISNPKAGSCRRVDS